MMIKRVPIFIGIAFINQHAFLLRAFTMLTMLSSPPCFRNALPLSVNVMRSMGTVPSFNRLNDGFQIIEPFILSSGCHSDAAARNIRNDFF